MELQDVLRVCNVEADCRVPYTCTWRSGMTALLRKALLWKIQDFSSELPEQFELICILQCEIDTEYPVVQLRH